LVTSGRRGGDVVEILSGLNPGEQVVARPVLGLQDGGRVEVRP
jgi:multidrug efflux pump subunit AcrA (membrane-fusion protein)